MRKNQYIVLCLTGSFALAWLLSKMIVIPDLLSMQIFTASCVISLTFLSLIVLSLIKKNFLLYKFNKIMAAAVGNADR